MNKHEHNNVRKVRIERMMTKTELARQAGLAILTIERIETGHTCRPSTKRAILQALGVAFADCLLVFPGTSRDTETTSAETKPRKSASQ